MGKNDDPLLKDTGYSPKDVLIVVESEIARASRPNNIRTMLNKYMVGKVNDQQLEHITAIIMVELRKTLERFRESLPEDDVEALEKIKRKVRRAKKIELEEIESFGDTEREVVGEVDGFVIEKVKKK